MVVVLLVGVVMLNEHISLMLLGSRPLSPGKCLLIEGFVKTSGLFACIMYLNISKFFLESFKYNFNFSEDSTNQL